ncbi:hypothetical protein D7V86_01610 [bacterium D16-51]|nr:hypothetical protein D7V96_01040 [bacterium D16-59]RKI62497.1 hypothetical protein D7V86_01610 [bacterium D16-51]
MGGKKVHNMGQIKIGFLGYGTRALDSLMEHPLYDVKYFFVPTERLCQDVYDAQEKYKNCLTMETMDNNGQLAARFAQIFDVDCFLMNACPIILNHEVLSKMRVFNIHPGDLHYNRGHQPHCWTVLLGERQTKIVMHSVNETIDTGEIIKSVDVEVSEDDSAGDVLNHAEDQIPVLLDALYQYLTGQPDCEEVVESGGYRRVMGYADYEILLPADTREQIKRKVLARSMHHGAFFQYGHSRIYVDKILSYQENGQRKEGAVTVQVQEAGQKVYVDSAWRSMVFHLNKIDKI